MARYKRRRRTFKNLSMQTSVNKSHFPIFQEKQQLENSLTTLIKPIFITKDGIFQKKQGSELTYLQNHATKYEILIASQGFFITKYGILRRKYGNTLTHLQNHASKYGILIALQGSLITKYDNHIALQGSIIAKYDNHIAKYGGLIT